MFIEENQKKKNYYIKYIDKNGTKDYRFWKHLISNKKITVFSENLREVVDFRLFKDIVKIKKVLETFKYPWEFDIVAEEDKLILKGFSFVVDELQITSEINTEETLTKKEMIYHVSFEYYDGHIKLSQPNLLTLHKEKNVCNSNQYKVHPHVSSVSSIPVSNKNESSLQDFCSFNYNKYSPFFTVIENSKVSSNICRGAGDVGQILTGAILEEQTPEFIEFYLINFIGLSKSQSDTGGPYWYIRNVKSLENYENNRINTEITEYFDDNIEEGYYKCYLRISDRVSKDLLHNDIKNLPFYSDPYLFLKIINNQDFKNLVVKNLSERDIEELSSAFIVDRKINKVSIEKIKKLLTKSKKYKKPNYRTSKYTKSYFKYEGVKYFLKKDILNKQEESLKDTILGYLEINTSFDVEEFIETVIKEIEEYVRKIGIQVARESFKTKIQSAIKSRERGAFENTRTVF